jgi:hypothetical protein
MGLSMGLSMGLCMRNSFCWVRQHRDIMGTARRCIWIDEEVGDTVGQEEDDRGGVGNLKAALHVKTAKFEY